MSDEQKDQNQGDSGKVEKRFKADLSFVTAVIGGENMFAPTKLVPDEVKSAMAELAKEEKEAAIKSLKEKAVAIIKKKREYDSNRKKLLDDFKKKDEENMKEFSKEVDGLRKGIDNIKELEKSYYDALSSADRGVPGDLEQEV